MCKRISLVRGGGGGGGGAGGGGGRGGKGGKHLSKTFSIFSMLNSKNGVFYPYFTIGTCPMRKRLLWISRGLNLLSFS